MPFAGDAFEIVHAALFELDARSGDQVLDGSRDEHLAGLSMRGDSCSCVHGDPGDLAVDELALPGVEARTQVEPQSLDRVGDRAGAADRPRRSVERGEEAVAGSV